MALDRYSEWLPGSDVYRGIDVVGEGPIEKGTTHADRQAGGADLSGHVRVCDPPLCVGFTQTFFYFEA